MPLGAFLAGSLICEYHEFRGIMLGMMLGNEIVDTKKPPVGGFTTLLIALIILLFSHGTRNET